MSAKNYIATAKGFVKSIRFNGKLLETEIIYVNKIRFAKVFSTKTANIVMNKHNIEGFIYKPYEQEVVRDMFVVKKRRTYGFDNDKENNVEEWMVEKAFMCKESDIAFLTSKSIAAQDVMIFEKAKTQAIELNLEMLDELNSKLVKLQLQKENQ